MSTRSPHVVIRASAGTGKTFQLSNRFIGLASHEPLDGILATTFTRKAAGEILDRVLVRLADAALEPKDLAELARHVALADGDPDAVRLDRARCLDMLRTMIRHLHRLRVSTLDSFFIQIAQSFSLELGLPPGWEIADEMVDANLRAEAVRNVLQDESTQDVVRLMHLLTKGEAARSVSEQIAGLVGSLYAIYVEAPADAWRSLPRKKQLDAAQLEAAIAAMAALPQPTQGRLAKAVVQDLASAASEDWLALLGKGLGAKVFDGSETYFKQPIPEEILEVYRPLVEHAKAVLVGRVADQTEATHQLLARFDAAYQRLKLERRVLRFEDVTRRLGEAAIAQRLEEVVYRLDGQVAHLLLDEFQDTSALQWRVLRPFAQRIVGDAGRSGEGDSPIFVERKSGQSPVFGPSFFCVGDVKQAIYGWRGGVAEIFDALDDELGPMPSRSLNESFRSAPAVIDCVNRVFESIGTNPVLSGKYPEAARNWADRFTPHTTARRGLRGYCRMIAAPEAAEGESQYAVTLRSAAEEVVRLHAESPASSIGVLVRRNDAVGRLIFELRSRGIDASEEGGNPLTDSPAVQLILSLVTLADHPGDTTARFHVAHSPLAEGLGLTNHANSPAAWRIAEQVRRQLVTDGYGRTVSDWARRIAAVCDRRDASRLAQLVELAYGYEDRASLRPADFVELVDRQKVEDPTSARVRVMTTHQAKGLQFDIVVLPELDVAISGQPPEVVAGSPKPVARIDRVCRYVSKDLQQMLPTEFQRLFTARQQRVVEESLCLLYVALTRAVHALHIVIAPPKSNERSVPATFAGVLRAALADAGPVSAGAVLYEHGEAEWFKPAEAVTEGSPDSLPIGAAKPQAGLGAAAAASCACGTPIDKLSGLPAAEPGPIGSLQLAPSPAKPIRSLDRRSPSGLEGGGRVNLAGLLRPRRGEALDRGELFHAWFEQIVWLEDGEPDDDALVRIARRLGLAHMDLPGLIAAFRAALRQPAVADTFRAAAYRQPAVGAGSCQAQFRPDVKEPRWVVYRERSFAVPDADGILSGKFDRLVVLSDGDRIVGADIVDFKTDDVASDDPSAASAALAARIEQYRPQMAAYHRAAVGLLRLDPARISTRLVFVVPGAVRAV